MDINRLPAKTSVLIDANVFIYHLGGESEDCKNFLKRVTVGEIDGYVTTAVIAEILHRRMMLEAVAKHIISPGQPLKKLKSNPDLIASLSDYITDVRDLLMLPIGIIMVTVGDIAGSHLLRPTYGLFVNDSINIACAQRLNISNIVTHDSDFSRVRGMTIWEPMDI